MADPAVWVSGRTAPGASRSSYPAGLRRPIAQTVRGGGNGAWLAEKDHELNKIYFDFNPEQIRIDHSAPADKNGGSIEEEAAGNGGATNTYLRAEDRLLASGATTVSIENIVFDGQGVQETCNQLLNWSYPVLCAAGSRCLDKPKVPLLKFKWGDFVIEGPLNRVTVTYKRFSGNGTPTRAGVSLSITQHNLPHSSTNPTSGGLPGRRRHVLASGECLPSIATGSYGGPGDWRALAEANQIDDPLRVRPGTVLYLPGPGELARPAVASS